MPLDLTSWEMWRTWPLRSPLENSDDEDREEEEEEEAAAGEDDSERRLVTLRLAAAMANADRDWEPSSAPPLRRIPAADIDKIDGRVLVGGGVLGNPNPNL